MTSFVISRGSVITFCVKLQSESWVFLLLKFLRRKILGCDSLFPLDLLVSNFVCGTCVRDHKLSHAVV